MSSNNSHSPNTNIAESLLIDEFKSLLKSSKTIIPFAKEHFLCQSLFNRKDVVYLDLSNYSAVEDYSSQDQIITVQTGIKIKALQNFLFQEKKFFPVSFYDDETSLLDIILSAETGSLEQFLGGLSRYVLGMSCILGTGELIKCGGKVVKNVSGYDLTRFFIGSYGYFAVPIRAHLRLCSLPEQNLTILIESDDWKKLLCLGQEIINTNISLSYMELVDQRLIETEEKFQFKKRFLLVLRTFGDGLVVKIASETIKNILAANKLPYIDVAASLDQEYFMHSLSQISWFTNKIASGKQKKAMVIDLSIKNNNLSILLEEPKLLAFPFIYRAKSNRLRFCVDSAIEQNALLDQLVSFALAHKMILPLAYGNDNYIRRVKIIGYDTNNGDPFSSIKKQLKEKFDPDNLFNPYVEL